MLRYDTPICDSQSKTKENILRPMMQETDLTIISKTTHFAQLLHTMTVKVTTKLMHCTLLCEP